MRSTKLHPLALLLACASLCVWFPHTHAQVRGYRECRQPNYITKQGKIYAVDPADESVETEIKIKGVSWSGMEKDNMIPEGLWGSEEMDGFGTVGTSVAKLLKLLTDNKFNSIRLPLNAQYVTSDPLPQVSFIHSYENRELVSFDEIAEVKYFDLLGRVIEVLGEQKITVLLDIHLLGKYSTDAFWYTTPMPANLNETEIYKAVSYLAKTLCSQVHWNVLGIDLKDAMTDAQWNAHDDDVNVKYDCRDAAQQLGNRVLELCPQWLVFVGGASSPTDFQKFSVGDDYEMSGHWPGGNLKNASARPVELSVANKVVLAPHAHAHGVLPRNYFFSSDSNCSSDVDKLGLMDGTSESECLAIENGEFKPSKRDCYLPDFGCNEFEALSASDLQSNYETVLKEAVGDVSDSDSAPVVLGAFSGVYGPLQPQQSAVLDMLIDYASNQQGGYFWSLNPNVEYYLEHPKDKKPGFIGRTHFGLLKSTTWQEANPELLEAMARMPPSEIPCYGEVLKEDNTAHRPLRSSTCTILAFILVVVSSIY